jgi:hypothetical protein
VKRIIKITFVCFFLILQACGMNLNTTCVLSSLSEKQSYVQTILAVYHEELSSEQVDVIGKIFQDENEAVCAWFKAHKKDLQSFIRKTVEDAHVKIMGSRRWKTNHLLSDVDLVIVTNSADHKLIFELLQAYYSDNYPLVTQIKKETRKGISIFRLQNVNDPVFGEIKVDYVIQNYGTNRFMIEKMTELLTVRFMSEQEKTNYAIAMMEATYNQDNEARKKLSSWARDIHKYKKIGSASCTQ